MKFYNGWNVTHLAKTYNEELLGDTAYQLSHDGYYDKHSVDHIDKAVCQLKSIAVKYETENPESTTALYLRKQAAKLEEVSASLKEASEAFRYARKINRVSTELRSLEFYDVNAIAALLELE